MTSMPLLPDWLRFGWVVALGAVIVTHLWHAYGKPGQHRWWHAAHVLMAAGMVVMYVPAAMTQPGLSLGGVVLLATTAVITAATAVVLRRREGALNPLWVMSAVDMLIMSYMWLPSAVRPSLVDYALAAYLGCQLLAWSLGRWEGEPGSTRPTAPAMAALATASPARAVSVRTATSPVRPSAAVGLVAYYAPVLRASVVVMVASMSYMLIAMQPY